MSAARPTHELIEELIAIGQGVLAEGYVLGYELPHTDVPVEAQLQADHEIKARWRDRLADEGARNKRGASADRGALRSNATRRADVDVLIEILHPETGMSVVRTLPLSELESAATSWQSAKGKQKETIEKQVQDYLKEFYALVEARVAEEQAARK